MVVLSVVLEHEFKLLISNVFSRLIKNESCRGLCMYVYYLLSLHYRLNFGTLSSLGHLL